MNLAELLIDENIDQVFALNTRLEITVWNKACEIATGFKKNDAIGKSISGFIPGMQADGPFADALQAALKGLKSFLPYGTSAGMGYAEQHIIPLKENGNTVIGILVITHDIAHRVKAEQELKMLNESLEIFRRIIESTNDTVITFDVDGNITYWNAAAEKLYGYTRDEIIGRSLGCLLPQGMEEQLVPVMQQLQQGNAMDMVVEQRTKPGGKIDVAVNIFPIIDGQGKFTGGCKIAKDITEILRYQASIEALNNELLVKNRQLASVNSELKTFTNIAVTNYSETLRQLYLHFEYVAANDAGKLSDPGKANIRKAQAAIQKMKLLTNDIISFMRLNEFDSEKHNIDLNEVLKTVSSDLKEQILSANAKLEVNKLPAIQGFPFLVSLVFHHLVDNAIKFRNDKEPLSIHVLAEGPQKGSDIDNPAIQPAMTYNVVVITDNGIGFDDTDAENIFGMFTRLHAGKYKGSGIGLAICRKAMELHGGFITAESEPGNGSTFRCYFPVSHVLPPYPSA